MHKLVAVWGLVACLAPVPALAGASATLTLNGRTLLLDRSGGTVASGNPFDDFSYGVTLAPGESADFSFEYVVTVRDDGLPVAQPTGPLGAAVFGCVPVIVRRCGPAYTGFETAKVDFDVAFRDGRVVNPAIDAVSDGATHVALETHGDSFAEVLTQSGSVHVHVTNTSAFEQSDRFLVYGAAWVLAVPEPATATLLLLGLAALAAFDRARRTRRPALHPLRRRRSTCVHPPGS